MKRTLIGEDKHLSSETVGGSIPQLNSRGIYHFEGAEEVGLQRRDDGIDTYRDETRRRVLSGKQTCDYWITVWRCGREDDMSTVVDKAV